MSSVDWDKLLEKHSPQAIIAMREWQFEYNFRRAKTGRTRAGETTHSEIMFDDEYSSSEFPRALDLIYLKEVLAALDQICGAHYNGEHPQKKERLSKFFELCENTNDVHKSNIPPSPADKMFLSRTRAKLRAWAKEQGDK